MAQFDVHENPRKRDYPLLLDVQADVLSGLETRAVVPLVRLKRYGAAPITRLNPTARIGGVEYILLFQEMAAISLGALGHKVTSLAGRRADLLAALDLLFTGI